MHSISPSQPVIESLVSSPTDDGVRGRQHHDNLLNVAVSQVAKSLIKSNACALFNTSFQSDMSAPINKAVCKTALSEAFLRACTEGDLICVKELVEVHAVNPRYEGNKAICMAAAEGRLEVLTYLTQNHGVNPAANNNFPLRWAALKGHVKVVKYLLSDPRVDPSSENNNALEWAVRNGHKEVLCLFLSHSQVKLEGYQHSILNVAVENGHTQIVQLLINDERINPAINNNEVMIKAIKLEQFDIVTLLLLDGRYANEPNAEEIRQKLIILSEASQVFSSKLKRMYNIAFDKLIILFQGLSVAGSVDLLQDIADQGGVTHGLFPLLAHKERQKQMKTLIDEINKRPRSA